jgi:hypothetical protein
VSSSSFSSLKKGWFRVDLWPEKITPLNYFYIYFVFLYDLVVLVRHCLFTVLVRHCFALLSSLVQCLFDSDYMSLVSSTFLQNKIYNYDILLRKFNFHFLSTFLNKSGEKEKRFETHYSSLILISLLAK